MLNIDVNKLPRSIQKWPLRNGTRRASIQNYGFGGSNAAAILECHDTSATCNGEHLEVNGIDDQHRKQTLLYVLSAKDEQAIRRMKSNLHDHIRAAKIDSNDERRFLANLAYTLGSRRSAFPWTVAFAADSLSTLASALDDSDGRFHPTKSDENVRLAWVFTGQGAQWHAMGRELITTFPVFRDSLLRCDGYIRELGASWNIMEELHRNEANSRVNNAEFSLPLSTAIQVALADLLWSWGIQPTGIASHSSGEAAAAYAAGALSARLAIGITYLWGMLTARAKPASAVEVGMMAVGLGRSDAEAYISQVMADKEDDACLVVGCVNSPSSVTVSGDLSAIEKLETLLSVENVFAKRLKITEAFHSNHMLPMADAFHEALEDLFKSGGKGSANGTSDSRAVIYSSPKSGVRMQSLELLSNPSHWIESMLQPVEFESSLRDLCWNKEIKQRNVDIVIEIGPHGALAGPIKQIMQTPELKAIESQYLGCLHRGQSSLDTMYHLAAELVQRGYRLNMEAINFPRGRDKASVKVLRDLPSYPWNHQTRYWREPRRSRALRQRTCPPHHLIGSQEPLSPPFAPVWAHVLRVPDIPWTRDHVVGSDMLLPGAAFISMAIEGISQAQSRSTEDIVSYSLRDVELTQALVLPGDEDMGVDVRLTITSCDNKSLDVIDWHRFSVHSLSGESDAWTEHCTGYIRTRTTVQDSLGCSNQPGVGEADPPIYSRKINAKELYDSLSAVGIRHGSKFQNIVRIQGNEKEAFCSFAIADTASIMPHNYESHYIVHPTTLDSVIQAAYTPLLASGARLRTALVPRRVKKIEMSCSISHVDAGNVLGARAVINDQNSRMFSANLCVVNNPAGGGRLIEMEGLEFQSLGNDTSSTENTCNSWAWAPKFSLLNLVRLQNRLSIEADPQETSHMIDLRRCTIHFIQDAAEQLTSGDVEGLDGHLKNFYDWMNIQLSLARQNKLGPGSALWLLDTAEQKVALQARVVTLQGESVNGEMLHRLGPALSAILRREANALTLMMDGGLLTRYYASALKWNRANAQAGELVRLAAHENPRCQVLEVGAGTGGCTEMVLRALGGLKGGKPVGRYDFTDISAGVFEQARQQFAGWEDVMTFRTLDIETDPSTQGFECGAYDLVVACQVLHATASVRQTLGNIRKLLKPGGKLVLVETTNDQLDFNFTCGLLPGWWLSEERKRQTRATPSLSSDMWNRMLRESGFGGVEFEVRDCEDADFFMISTIMSTATDGPVGAMINGNKSASLDMQQVVLLQRDDLPAPSGWLNDLQGVIAAKTGASIYIQSLGKADTTGKICIFLGEVEQSLLATVDDDVFRSVKSALVSSASVLWVTRGATMASQDPWKALHLGLLRTLRNERNGNRYVSLDVDPSRDPWTSETVDVIYRVLTTIVDEGPRIKDFEFAERDGIIHVPRAFKVENFSNVNRGNAAEVALEPFDQPGRQLRMDVKTPGLLDTLYFRDDVDHASENLPDDWVEIEPRAFGLNSRDVMVAMGQLKSNRVMGFECSGVIKRLGKTTTTATDAPFKAGDRVCALLTGHWSTTTRTQGSNVVRIPDTMTFEEAASIPLAFTTAYIALNNAAQLQRGDRVLIHCGAGGVGQAAIALAQLAGAEVFVTAGTQTKRDLLTEKFQISPDRIFSSRDASFVEGVKARCGSVDVVLNSLAGDLLQKSFDCMAEFGRFVEIGKRDLEQNSRLGMLAFTRNVSFSSVEILAWQRAKGPEIAKALQNVMRLLEEKAIELIGPISVYQISAVEKAFRVMQGEQHMGKIVVAMSGKNSLVPVRTGVLSLKLRPDASYLVVGGLGGLGRRICQWLVDHGAAHLIILSRNATAASDADAFVATLQLRGCIVRRYACDVCDETTLAALPQLCEDNWNMPPIRGIIQAAMVQRDALLTQMTTADFHAAIRPKVQGSWNLHKVTAGQDIDFFVMLSSLVGTVGSAGQANYAAANVFLDALANHLRALGRPAVTIGLGIVKIVDYMAEAGAGVAQRLEKVGYKPLHEEDVLALLERAILSCSLSSSSSVPSSCGSDASWSHSLTTSPTILFTGINTSPGAHWTKTSWIQEDRFQGLKYRDAAQIGKYQDSAPSQQQEPDSLRAELSDATTHEEAVAIVLGEIIGKLMHMFGLKGDDASSSKDLASIGVDSLVAIELCNWVTARFKVEVSLLEVLESRTVDALAERVVQKHEAKA